jgi:Flp pilus assembly protein TadD
MKRIWLAVVVVVVAAAALSLLALPRGQEWTTSSPEALAEFDAAVDAMMKVYHTEARTHLERALELDPGFVIAKLYLAEQLSRDEPERAEKLTNEVLAADTTRLSPRERLIVERLRANRERRSADGARMLDDYLEEHPDDPFILHLKALECWMTGDFDEAERLNRRLIEIAPNWVIAYNQLGYIAMSRGRFAEAEEYFSSYRFVAPDQANPHDSLGELFIITGRYDEAEASLLRSIEIKPDFWAAYEHLALARVRAGDLGGAERALEMARATGSCPDSWLTGIDCLIRLKSLAETDRWHDLLALVKDRPECSEGSISLTAKSLTHLAASLVGEREVAQSIEDDLAAAVGKVQEGSGQGDLSDLLAVQSHIRGVRLALDGDLEGALESFQLADRSLNYMQAGSGLYKLCNRLFEVETLLAAGDDDKAREILAQVRSVNPRMADQFEERGLRILGLKR